MTVAHATPTRRSSESLVIAVKSQGVVLPRYESQPEVPLGLAELELIADLAGGATTERSSDADEALLAALDQRGLLVEDGAAPVRRPAGRGRGSRGPPLRGRVLGRDGCRGSAAVGRRARRLHLP